MRILDVELRDAIKDMPDVAVEDVLQELDKVMYRIDFRLSDRTTFDTDILKQVIDSVREKYGLEKTNELDDDKAIQDIEDPVEQEYLKLRREEPRSSEKRPVRQIPQYAANKIIEKEILMRKGAKYVEKMSAMSLDQIASEEKRLVDRYGAFGQDYRLASEIDPQFGLDVDEKIDILRYLKAEKYLNEQISDFSRDELKQMKQNFEDVRNDRNTIYGVFKEMDVVGKRIGIDTSSIRGYMTMADVADAFEAREKEVSKSSSKINIFGLLKNAFKGKPTRDSIDNSRNAGKIEKRVEREIKDE